MAQKQIDPKAPQEKPGRRQKIANPASTSSLLSETGDAGGSVLRAFAGFVSENVLKIGGASLAILIPCFWHAHLEAGDLASHTYNAWLAQLASRGQAPGLYIVPQWGNVTFDYLLLIFTRALGFGLGEKLAVSLCVLVFFWGAFTLVSTMAGRAAWTMAPLLAMLSYGWMFHVGFFNQYLASGVSLWALALVWCGAGWELALLLPLVLLISRTHLMGLVWVVAAGVYLALARILPRRWHLLLIGGTLAGYFGIQQYMVSVFEEYPRSPNSLPWLLGADQLVIYGPVFFLVAIPLLILAGGLVLQALLKDRQTLWPRIAAPLPLFGILAIAAFFAPGGIYVPQFAGAMNFLPDRLTAYAAIVGCCVLGALPLRKWQVTTFAVLAVAFFSLLYAATLKVNAMETKIQSLLAPLPARSRVLQMINPLNCRAGFTMGHIVDRSCIGHCFSYSNYEPASLQFRVRATPGNSIVTASETDASNMQEGGYLVTPSDLPAQQVVFCGPKVTDLCLKPLTAGQMNGDMEMTRPRWW